MTAVQIGFDEFLYWLDPPELRRDRFEWLTDEEAERLLTRRFRAFSRRGLDWHEALLLAVSPDQPA